MHVMSWELDVLQSSGYWLLLILIFFLLLILFMRWVAAVGLNPEL